MFHRVYIETHADGSVVCALCAHRRPIPCHGISAEEHLLLIHVMLPIELAFASGVM